MANLYKLIRELRPCGVEYTTLGEVCQIQKGFQLNKELLSDIGEYPVINGGIMPSGYWTEYNFSENLITISQGGASAGYVNFITSKFWAGAHCFVLTNPIQEINYRYLYHIMKKYQSTLMASKVGAGIPSVAAKTISSLIVPLPPLPVQAEIVRILDNFTELTAELTEKLTAELTARKKQYEYYHDELMDFSKRTDLDWVCVGDYFTFKNGINKGKEYFGSGDYIVNFTDVYNNRWLTKEILKGRVQTEPKDLIAYDAKKGDVFFTRTSETKEDIGMASTLIEDIERCVFSGFVLRARPLSNYWLPKFCSYYFSSSHIRNDIVRYASFTTRALTSGPRLSKLKIPLLPISEQERIVSILDRFDKLCNDISGGLPAEIAARQKQYEYYRNKLLTFKEIS